ncbi:conserved domain protein [Turicibacter sanguinis PC909]|uniref:Conserved domain protein n=1 Tax=Turicibacter sanguinis PC909 TaxID=702450 RepID=A0ABP2HZ33_9FIRM|nr:MULTISPECIES: ATP-binding cassette domain-containing protein [Turicibacter]EFF62878.1 conserved domain protein [Turicibacter sanguinis PC909]EGC92886.1 dipeptide ABC transporter, ATP-binding protein DppD domain protein [Turicibacter sp. HGF1]
MSVRKTVLSVKDLEIQFKVRDRRLNAIRRISLDLYEGETLAIVGESGSGKSVLIKSFTGMLESNGEIVGGEILFEGQDISKLKKIKNGMAFVGLKLQRFFKIR